LSTAKNRVLSGMRPTGRLHIGHYFGALQNWVKLQSDPAYDCFFFVADWHALTSDYADTSAIAENSLQITIDFLASGLDPTKSTIFLQSQVPEHAELHLLLSMITPLGWLERIPTYKEQLDNIQNKDLHTYGFLGYPTLQTADIVLYSPQAPSNAPPSDSAVAAASVSATVSRSGPTSGVGAASGSATVSRPDLTSGVGAALGRPSLFVPVGEDQVSHVEFSRELVRRFNGFYGLEIDMKGIDQDEAAARRIANILPKLEGEDYELFHEAWRRSIRNAALEWGMENFLKKVEKDIKYFHYEETLTEPAALLTPTPRIPGLDGRKMSKSYGNAITLSESDDDIRKKTKVMVTDPARKRRTDPGNPDVCPVFDWHKLFSTEERDPGRQAWVRQGCTTAGIGCIDCKSAMAENLIKWIEPIRNRRLQYENDPKAALKILDEGSEKARQSAQQTMQRVRNAIFHWPQKRAELK
jgi:tryptophanyl-tRNA synthetase